MTEKQLLAWSPAFCHQEEGKESQYDGLEYTNKIILSEDILYEYKDDKDLFPLTFRVINPVTLLSTICSVQEFTALPGTCIIPYRIMDNLMIEQGAIINLVYEMIPQGSYIKIKPHKTKFIELSDPKVVLEKHLNINYPTLTKGETISINYNNDIYFIDIVETKPVESIKILNSDINLDFDEPLDYVKPPTQPTQPTQATQATQPTQSTQATQPTQATHSIKEVNEIIRPESIKKRVEEYSKTKESGVFVPFSGKGYTLGNK